MASRLIAAASASVERVADAVAEQVQPKYGDDDGEA